MKPDSAYQTWMSSHAHADVSTDFVGRVMEQVYQRERRTPLLRRGARVPMDRLSVGLTATVGLIKAALAAMGMVVGLGRFGLALLAFLGC